MEVLRNLDVKGIIEITLLLLFGLSVNQITQFLHSEMNFINNVGFDSILDYLIKGAVLAAAVIKGIIEYKKLRSINRKNKNPEEE